MIAGDDIIGDARASYPPFVHLARGCRWEKSALTAMISGVYTRAPVTRGVAASGNSSKSSR
jgi:hypothetical protein